MKVESKLNEIPCEDKKEKQAGNSEKQGDKDNLENNIEIFQKEPIESLNQDLCPTIPSLVKLTSKDRRDKVYRALTKGINEEEYQKDEIGYKFSKFKFQENNEQEEVKPLSPQKGKRVALPFDLQDISSPDYFQFRNKQSKNEDKLEESLFKSGINMKKNKKNLNLADPKKIYRMHLNEMINSIKIMKTLSPGLENQYKSKLVNLPKLEFKFTIVFDIDETLLHVPKKPNETPGNIFLEFTLQNGQKAVAGIHLRPHVKECLQETSKFANVILFTAGIKSYAETIYQYFDPNHEYIKLVLSRDHCIFDKSINAYIKDLRILGLDMNFCFLVDNSAISFALNLENGIPALPYFDDDSDEYLIRLVTYLKRLTDSEYPLQTNRDEFKLNEISKSSIFEFLYFYNNSPYHPRQVVHSQFNFSQALNLKSTDEPQINSCKSDENTSHKISFLLNTSQNTLSAKTQREIEEILKSLKGGNTVDPLYSTPQISSKKVT